MINQIEPNYGAEEVKGVSKYLDSGGWLTEHKLTEDLDNKIKSFVKRKYAISVPNGTIAIYLALKALGIGKGKRVAVPNLTMIATVNAVIWSGAEPILIDVDEKMCMSFEKLKKIKNLDAIIFVPLNGRTSNGVEIEKWSKEKGIYLIEDSAHALGSKYSNHKPCGSLGDISIFSFTPHKIITMGQGGMVLTNNKKTYTYLNELKTFNRSKDKSDVHKGFGLNFKITDLQASFGLEQFKKLNKFIKKKNEIFQMYKNNLKSDYLELIEFKKFEVPWFIDISITNKKNLKLLSSYLKDNGIETRLAYPPLNKQKYIKDLKSTNLDNSKKFDGKVLWLPSSTNLSEKDISFISNKINKFTSRT